MSSGWGSDLSLMAQITSLGSGLVIGRWLQTKALIWLISFAACGVAMIAHLMYDGQGAFLIMLYAPLIYWLSIAGRDQWRPDR